MPKSCVTISLVAEARGGPFVYWDDLAAGCRAAAELGFDAVEIFAPGPLGAEADADLKKLLDDLSLELAAVGTGAGWLLRKLSLTDPNAELRRGAVDFIKQMIDWGVPHGAPAIIGSMQGRFGDDLGKEAALAVLAEGLEELGAHAGAGGVKLLYEPLNRYETNLVNTIADGVNLVTGLETQNVALLADLFHMNIEEVDVADALRAGASHIGHIHFVDSNRRAASGGHTDFAPIAEAVREIEYDGYLSAEAFPLPDPQSAAEATITAYRRWF